MIKLLPAKERGHANHGWLDSYHSFSFADYYDPEKMGFRALRVINEDVIDGGMGFSTHGHQDMEIITYVIDGVLEHKDTLGNSAPIRPGEVQYMCAGTGIRHSEFNHLKNKKTHLLQIWILPDRKGHKPSYGQKSFLAQLQKQPWTLVVSPDGREDSVRMHQDACLWVGKFSANQKQNFSIVPSRFAWIQVVHGSLSVNGQSVQPGDGLAIEKETSLDFHSATSSEILLFDLA